MKNNNKFIIFALTMAIALIIAACWQPTDENLSRFRSVTVTGVTLDKTNITLTVGEQEVLTATVSPADASNKRVSWSSDNPSVASVNNGMVTAIAEGSATITVTTADGGITEDCTVIVVDDSASGGTITNVSLVISAPTKDEIPAVTATGRGHFTIGLVTWSPEDNPFLGGIVYTATVTLTAEDDYTFVDFTSAMVNGQSSEVSDNTGGTITVSHTFPATDTRTAVDIEIQFQPSKLVYNHGDALNLAGLAIKINFSNSTSDFVFLDKFAVKNVTTSQANGDTLSAALDNGRKITVSYGSHTVETGALTVNPIAPTTDDFTVHGHAHVYDGSPKTVTVTAKDDKTTGTISDIKYNGSTAAPSNVGVYSITIDVAADDNYTAISGLKAGTLTIVKANPITDDFIIHGQTHAFDGGPKTVTVTAKEGKTTGTVSGIKYNGNITAPSAVGEYSITIDVTEDYNYTSANYLYVGTMTITAPLIKINPTADDFILSGHSQDYDGTPKTVTVTAKYGKTTGIISNIKYNGSATAPSAIGTYTITIDVAADNIYASVSGLSIGTLNIYTSFNSVADFKVWLDTQPANTAETSYNVKLNVNNLGGSYSDSGSLGNALYTNRDNNKYVSLDLSDSTFTSMEHYAFSDCNNLTGITIPNTVTSIAYGAFSGCTNLTSVTFTAVSKVTNIEWSVFSGCTSLTNVTIPNSVTNIEGGAFSGCTSLTNVTIPNSVTSIGSYAFDRCASLAAVTIGNRVTGIGQAAFYGCARLTSVTFTGTIPSSGFSSNAFGSSGNNGYLGDIRAKFYAANASNGTPGTYTRPGSGSVWTKQP